MKLAKRGYRSLGVATSDAEGNIKVIFKLIMFRKTMDYDWNFTTF